MLITKFEKEDSRAELSLSTDRSLRIFKCIDRKNLYDNMLDGMEIAANQKLKEPKRSEVITAINKARETNNLKKCLEESVHSQMADLQRIKY